MTEPPPTNPDQPFSYRWLIVLIVVAAGVYGFHVATNFRQLNDLNQRELSSATRELKRAAANAKGTVEKLGLNPGPGKVCEFDLDQPYLDAIGDCSKATGDFSKAKAAVGASGLEIHAGNHQFRFRVDTVLQEMPFPESFRLVFLTDPKGRILFQEAPEPRRWLRRLRWSEREFRENAASESGALRIRDLSAALGAGAKPDFTALSAASSRLRMSLDGEGQQVYLQPVNLDNGAGTDLILGGVVPTEEVLRQALAVDTYFVALLVFVFLLGLLGLPFVKLIVLDARERFRVRDVYRLYLSSVALLALLTYVILAVDAWARYAGAADAGLQRYASNLESKLLSELGAVKDQLASYDNQLSGLPPRNCRDWEVQSDWLHTPGPKQTLRLAGSVHLEQAAWLAPDGGQIWKATTDKIGSKVRVPRRDYFRSIQTGNFYRIDGVGGPRFYWGPSRSITDGKFYTFLSMESTLPGGFCTDARGPYVAVATVHLMSLDRQALPPGYGFALFNREGDVLYHSDARLSLRENLFAEVSSPSKVKSLVTANQGRALSLDYRERPHEFYLLPLGRLVRDGAHRGPSGLFIAVFRDVSSERAVIAHVFVTSLIGPLLLLIAVSGVALWAMAVVCRRKTGRSGVWLWPHGALQPLYQRLTWSFLAVLATGVAIHSLGASEAVYLLMPPVAVVAGISAFVARDWGKQDRRRLISPRWHRTELTLLMLCMVVAPASALFRMALGHEFGTLIRTGQLSIAEQAQDAALALRAEAIRATMPASAGDRVAAMRPAHSAPPPAPFDHAMLGEIGAGSWLVLRPHEWLGDMLPVENETGVMLRHRKFNSTYAPPGLFGEFPPRISAGACAAFALLVALLIAWIRWNSNRLFLADLEAIPLVAAEDTAQQHQAWWDDCSGDERYILVQVAEEHVFNPYQRRTIEKLLAKGLLRLAPDIQPRSAAFTEFILEKGRHQSAALHDWEQVDVAHSWRYARLILLASLGLLALFLVATQPGLQSELLGVATGLAGGMSALVKVRDAIASWLEKRKSAAA
ncbi:MAG: hypothetical protein SFV51_31335 [Bryobacteraceae bacterium]|nr:hypothetical protein [Bryobacteraceae bacterium]